MALALHPPLLPSPAPLLARRWFIGISRLWDNRHHISDILGGFLLSMLLGTFQAIKAVGQYAVIKAQLDAASKGQRRQSPPALPVAAAGPRNAAGPASPPFNGNGQLAGGGAGRNGVGAGMQMGRLPQGGPAAPPAGPYSA
ncbi:hypothetical protein MNEG_0403 [Monoraphidium neglectum]|uniref:Phosphatidic acid phosphatase type 2/haloperoxidase domain-containing protein n=1 Tax=Monoraphidium neglectum TaxID=145388 RepID=A0A0D2NTQ3_9CHLO|nr:hypothetical protein MNEG_0403 [Monoraphidium neglectum]KIZ07541.1 hypothetical protein MNEG_0403 [Monoraphidium neglectum]|eukprot:XP_013906560.1 hypothetical protein MNEG_0403 [Monoraphidium neglectum]